jgi:hypothetical protein
MTKDEALRLALDSLEDIGDEWGFTSQRTVPKRKEAITTIKEALAQTEQDWIERERAVGYREGHRAALAQRTWVGLTLDEQGDLYSEYSENPALLYRAFEAKLKEKNT